MSQDQKKSINPMSFEFFFENLKKSFVIWYGLFFPKKDIDDLSSKFPKFNNFLNYANSLLRLILLLFIIPAIPFIIILTVCLEGFRYFFSKFMLL